MKQHLAATFIPVFLLNICLPSTFQQLENERGAGCRNLAPLQLGNNVQRGEKFRSSHRQDDVCPVSHLMSVGKMMGREARQWGRVCTMDEL